MFDLSLHVCSFSPVIAIVVNNHYFIRHGLKDLAGTDHDAEALTRLFIYLGFYTNRYDNLKGNDIRKRLRVGLLDSPNKGCFDVIQCTIIIMIQDMADLDHSKFDCMIIAILTHGISGKLYGVDGDTIGVEEILS